MRIQSPAVIEFDLDGETYVLCELAGWMTEMLRVRGQQELFERDGYLQEDSWFEALGGAIAQVTFATEETFDTLEAAQAAFESPDVFEGVSLMQAIGTLRVITGETTGEWEGAVLQEVTPTLPADGPAKLVRAFLFLTPAAPVIS